MAKGVLRRRLFTLVGLKSFTFVCPTLNESFSIFLFVLNGTQTKFYPAYDKAKGTVYASTMKKKFKQLLQGFFGRKVMEFCG